MAGATRGRPPAANQALGTFSLPVSEGFLPSQTAKTTRPRAAHAAGAFMRPPSREAAAVESPALMSKADLNAYKKINRRRAQPAAIIICTTSCFLSRASFISHCFPFQVGPWAPRCSASRASSAGAARPPQLAAGGHLCLPAPAASPGPGYFRKQQLSRRRLLIVCQTPSSLLRSHAEIRAPLVTPFPPPPFPIPR